MATEQQENVEMKNMGARNTAADEDYEYDIDEEGDFGGTAQEYPNLTPNTRILFDYDAGENYYWNEGQRVYLPEGTRNLSLRLTLRLRTALTKIFKFNVVKKHSKKLFERTRLRVR